MSPTIWYDAQRAVNIGDNSLNLSQIHFILSLAASSTLPPEPNICHPEKIIWDTLHPHTGLNLNLLQHRSEQNMPCNGDQHCSSIYQICHCTFHEPICDTQRTNRIETNTLSSNTIGMVSWNHGLTPAHLTTHGRPGGMNTTLLAFFPCNFSDNFNRKIASAFLLLGMGYIFWHMWPHLDAATWQMSWCQMSMTVVKMHCYYHCLLIEISFDVGLIKQ